MKPRQSNSEQPRRKKVGTTRARDARKPGKQEGWHLLDLLQLLERFQRLPEEARAVQQLDAVDLLFLFRQFRGGVHLPEHNADAALMEEFIPAGKIPR